MCGRDRKQKAMTRSDSTASRVPGTREKVPLLEARRKGREIRSGYSSRGMHVRTFSLPPSALCPAANANRPPLGRVRQIACAAPGKKELPEKVKMGRTLAGFGNAGRGRARGDRPSERPSARRRRSSLISVRFCCLNGNYSLSSAWRVYALRG
jgi:hypothetical protein